MERRGHELWIERRERSVVLEVDERAVASDALGLGRDALLAEPHLPDVGGRTASARPGEEREMGFESAGETVEGSERHERQTTESKTRAGEPARASGERGRDQARWSIARASAGLAISRPTSRATFTSASMS